MSQEKPMAQSRFSQLSAPRQELIRQCQKIGFGEIGRFLVRDREPVLTPETEFLLDVKLDGDDGPRPEGNLNDFELRREVVLLFARLDAIRNGVVERLEVYAGLPRRIRFKAPLEK
jgi:hypothetical protein